MRKPEARNQPDDQEDNPYLTSKLIVTAPNIATAVGVGLVVDGVRRGINTPIGTMETLAGKGMDLVDGWLARNALDTRIGQAVAKHTDPRRLQGSISRRIADPVADRYVDWKIFSELWRGGSMPKAIPATILATDLAGTAFVVADIATHPEKRAERRPDNTSKLGFVLQGVGALALHVDHMITERSSEAHPRISRALQIAGWSAFAGGTALKVKSLGTYASWARGKA